MSSNSSFHVGELVRFIQDYDYLAGIGLVMKTDYEKRIYLVRWLKKGKDNYYDMWMKSTELEKVSEEPNKNER